MLNLYLEKVAKTLLSIVREILKIFTERKSTKSFYLQLEKVLKIMTFRVRTCCSISVYDLQYSVSYGRFALCYGRIMYSRVECGIFF